MTSEADDRARRARPETNRKGIDLGQKLLAGGGLLGALAASSCCLVPLTLFAIGIGGAWIGYLTRLAPYQPYFLAVAAGCVGFGYWLRHRSKKIACSDGEICARPLPNRTVTIGFVFAMVLIVAALALDFLAPLFL
jgi:mercuric ion transport protein